ncbi:major facilitator superfamily transporter [Colletotrichum godetiae]|uniref:Major facilitator superfamily transporter n=1 Tax=Colletotrichum godetiae TaxID=1209918 RepID=A0AAJ0EWZ1_9PEZI|nr:major facilitator superfamily transporter [Colletotrichum godetiae]KAK1674725.1 major facilitator superfamily transporter [Colletotrichum godetiae]
MALTMQKSLRNPDDFPTIQLFLLAIVRLAEPIALTSIFPYAWALVKRFEIGNAEDASFYAGLLISSFSLAEALMGMYWGGLSDRIGRKPVLLLGCVGTMFSMVMVGFASNIWIALAGRAIGGLLNGNIGVIQTMVGELVTKPEHEPRAFSVMPFVWSIGTIIGPFIGGTFADPHDAFPSIFPVDGMFYRYPYLLPNLVCAGLLFVSIILGYFLLEETHPDMQPRVFMPDDTYASEETPLLETSDAMKRPAVDLRDDNYGTVRGRSAQTPAKKADQSYNIYTKPIMSLILALCIFTYHSMTYDHLLPIFFEDDRANAPITVLTDASSPFYTPGGLGLSLRAVGMIMAVNGVIALFVQAVIFPFAAEKFGVYRLFIIVTVLHPIAYVMVPSLLFLPESFVYAGIYFCLAVRNVLSIILYPLLLILIKEVTPTPKALGKVNGLAASAAAGFRMVAPPVAGWLYTFGSKVDCTALAWYGSAVVAVIGAIQCFSVKRERKYEVSEEDAQPCLQKKESRVSIREVFSDEE